MKAVIQRVTKGSVTVEGKKVSEIGQGVVVLIGIHDTDTSDKAEQFVDKLLKLRIMSDKEGKMNKSLLDVHGEVLLVSQFTLCADLSAGRRPSFIHAMKPDNAEKMYKNMVHMIEKQGITVKTGKFGTYMDVQIANDGPVTIVMDL